jgi:hypothetical protein
MFRARGVRRGVAGVSVFLSFGTAWAGSRDQMGRARRSLEDALDASQHAGGPCEKTGERIQRAIDALTELRRQTTPDRLKAASAALSDSGVAAVTASCPTEIADQIRAAGETLDLAGQLLARERAHQSSEDAAPIEAAPPPSGHAVISSDAFARLLKAVHDTKDEVFKGEVAKDGVGKAGFTAKQLDQLLAEMNSDVVKLDVVTVMAHAVIDPQNAQQVAQRFDAPELGQEAAAAMSGK